MFKRSQLAMLVAEFLGTGVLALVVLTVQHSTIGLPYFVALAAGATLAVMAVALGRDGGGHFNPAVTLGLWTTRQVKTVTAVTFVVAQLLGAWAAYYLYTYFARTTLQSMNVQYDSHVLVAEAVGAMVLSLGWAAAVFDRYSSSKAAVTAGASFALAIVVASSASLGIVNPAVALSDRAFEVFGPMGWTTYALGPVLGAVIGFNLYALLFAPESSLLRLAAAVSARAASAGTTAGASAKAPAARVAKAPAKKRAASRPARSTRKK